MSARIRVYVACSLDGFIAGPQDDLSWLPQPIGPDAPDFGFGAFMAEIGALLMGRRTYDVVSGFGNAWPYGERPVLVATHRPLDAKKSTVSAVSGPIEELVRFARETTGTGDVYIDGGNLIRQALDAGLVDELVVTLVPQLLGSGHSLFSGIEQRQSLTLVAHERLDYGMIQLKYLPSTRD